MPKFRKKPIAIEAHQFFLPDGIFLPGVCCCVTAGDPHVHTLEGPLRVRHGDWVIRGVKGEYYPCDSEVFEQTYDRLCVQCDGTGEVSIEHGRLVTPMACSACDGTVAEKE